MGTPNEKLWSSIVELPDYKPDFPVYPSQKITSIVSGLDEDGYDLLSVITFMFRLTCLENASA